MAATRPEALRLFAVAAPGLESLVDRELRALGTTGRVVAGGVAFDGSLAALRLANLHLRTASRILVRLGSFQAVAFHELERRAARIPWELAVDRGAAVVVRATCRKSRLYHSDAVVERVLAAIDKRVGGIAGVEEEGAQLIVVRLDRDRVTVSADSSGALLHRRGYRLATARAPLRETLAAALLMASGWDPKTPLLDPFCGAGTIPIEGAMMARRIAPGLSRRFAFEHWPGFDRPAWEALIARARDEILPAAPARIQASDRDAGAIEAARDNAARAEVLADLEIECRPLSAVAPPGGEERPGPDGQSPAGPGEGGPAAGKPGAIVTNPPYGVRVGERGPLRDLYARLGQVALSRFPGWTVAVLSADPALERQLRLRIEERLRTVNGGIPVRLVVGRAPE